MSIRNGVWMRPDMCKPPEGEYVLCVKKTKNGTKSHCFGAWYGPDKTYPEGHWVTGGSCSNIILWMPLPRIPE